MLASGLQALGTGRIGFPQAKRRSSSVETRSAVSSARKKLRFDAPAASSLLEPRSRSSSSLQGISELPGEIKAISIPPSDTELHTPGQVSRARRVRKKPVELPGLEVKTSQVPMGGLGVFAVSDIAKGTLVTEYGGEVIDYEEASRRRSLGQDTHIRSLGRTECLDSRVRGQWDVSYYARHHMMGGFLNDAHGTSQTTNCEYVPVDCHDEGYQHPYQGGVWVSKRVWIRTKKDVQKGEELLVSYGSTYHTLHF